MVDYSSTVRGTLNMDDQWWVMEQVLALEGSCVGSQHGLLAHIERALLQLFGANSGAWSREHGARCKIGRLGSIHGPVLMTQIQGPVSTEARPRAEMIY